MQVNKILKRDWLLLIVLILISLSSQIIFIRPVTLSDQMAYYGTAVQFPRLPENPSHWSMRLGVVLPVAVLYRVFGHSEFVYYFLPISSTILLVVSTYLIGRMLFNPLVGTAAAIWMSFLPYFLLESGNLLPDITASACITTGIMLMLLITNLSKRKKSWWIWMLVGAFFGWAYLSKEYFAVFAIIIPVFFWLFKIPKKDFLPVVIGVVAVIMVEFTLHTIAYGNPLQRLSTSQPRGTDGFIERDVLHILELFFVRLAGYQGWITVLIAAGGLIYLVVFSVKRSKTHRFLIAWILMIYLFLTAVGLLPTLLHWKNTVLLRLHLFRYWFPMLPPLAIGSAAALDHTLHILVKKISSKAKNRNTLYAFGMIFIFSAASIFNMLAVQSSTKFLRNGGGHYQELRSYLQDKNRSGVKIWIVRDLKVGYEYVLPIFSHTTFGREVWNGRIKYLNTDGVFLKAEEISDGSVLIDHVHFNPEAYPIPDYLEDIPDNWQLAFESSNARITIYDVP